ncbi:MAG: BamA/TamA family outer membrane protein [Chitinivibrionales bacterium]|nr:BamA/TamA family outer membrane protein [Chitinivibrionales bacterium]
MDKCALLLCIILIGIPVDVVFGRAKPVVDDVIFAGNETFPRDILLQITNLQPAGFFRKTDFSEFMMDMDVRALERFHRSKGFIDVSVESWTIKDDGEDRVDVKFDINEGKRVVVDSLSLAPNPVITDSPAAEFLKTEVDSPLNMAYVNDDADTLEDILQAAGFLEAKVEPRVDIDSNQYLADVRFEITEGPGIMVENIRIEGLTTVKPLVVRRELKFEPGDTLTSKRIRKSQRRLYRTGLFRFVRIEPLIPDSAETLTVIDTAVPVVITIDQTDYYTLEAGIGYSSTERVRTSLELSYANFLSRGHRITLEGELSGIEQRAALRYATPWLFIFPLQTSLSAFYRRIDTLFFEVPLGFSGEFAGIEAALGRQTDFHFAYRFWLMYEKVLRVSAASLDTLPEDVSNRDTRSIGVDLTYDRRNDIFLPTKGIYALATSEVAGILGGGETNQFVKTTALVSGYTHWREILYFATGVEAGWAKPWGESEIVPPQEQFFAGGPRSVRGYELNNLVTNETGEPVGGNVQLVFHVIDIRFPLFWWFYGAGFLDAGFVWQDTEIVDLTDIKYGAGPGLRLVTPVGMFRFDVGFKLDKEEDQSLVELYFDFGMPF